MGIDVAGLSAAGGPTAAAAAAADPRCLLKDNYQKQPSA